MAMKHKKKQQELSDTVRDTVNDIIKCHAAGTIEVRCPACGLPIIDHHDLQEVFITQKECIGCRILLNIENVRVFSANKNEKSN
jgi:hypothetical protein